MGTFNRCVKNRLQILNRLWKNEKMWGPLGWIFLTHTVYRITRCGDMAIRVSWGHMEPHFGGREVLGVSDSTIRKSDMEFSYRLSIMTVALSVTIRPQFAIECLRRSNQQGKGGVGHFGPKFPGVPLGVDPWCLGLHRATFPCWLMVKLFQQNSNLCDHNPPTLQTEGQTDRQTDDICDRKTALCTKVHRTVKCSATK